MSERTTTMAENRKSLLTLLESGPTSLITFHRRPDGDALGGALGLSLWLESRGTRVHVVNADGVPDPFGFLPSANRVLREAPPDVGAFTAFVLDTPDLSRAAIGEGVLDAAERIVNIDHHPGNTRFGDIDLVDPTASSVALLVFELLGELGGVTADMAGALYVGAMTDTGGFRFGNTDSRTLRAAAELVELGASPSALASLVYGEQPLGRLRLLGMVLSSTETLLDGKIAVSRLTENMRTEAGSTGEDIEGLAGYGRLVEGVEVALMLREESGRVRVSLRSKGNVDVNAVARRLGGGGHSAAAGAWVDGPIDAAIERLVAAVSETMDEMSREDPS